MPIESRYLVTPHMRPSPAASEPLLSAGNTAQRLRRADTNETSPGLRDEQGRSGACKFDKDRLGNITWSSPTIYATNARPHTVYLHNRSCDRYFDLMGAYAKTSPIRHADHSWRSYHIWVACPGHP